jgi:hypothetical protein
MVKPLEEKSKRPIRKRNWIKWCGGWWVRSPEGALQMVWSRSLEIQRSG